MTEINVQLVPTEFGTLAEQAPKVAEAITQIEKLGTQLPAMLAEARTLEVKHPDREAYTRIGEILTTERLLRKQGEAYMSPFNILAARLVTALRTITQKFTNACEVIDSECIRKMKSWQLAEKAATEVEQKQDNKSAAKTGRPAATVQKDVPKTQGYRMSTLYRCERQDEAKFWRAFFKNPRDLKQFVYIDDQAIQKMFREDVKDPAKMAEMVPGFRFWVE